MHPLRNGRGEQMTERTFLIQRYASGNWPKIKGQEPFIVTGPRFSSWALPKSLERFNEYRFTPKLKQEIDEVLGELPADLARECAASILLREGIVQALWADHRESVPKSERWDLSIKQIAAEIPHGSIGAEVLELLSGMGSPEHCRSYVSEDEIVLTPVEVVQDGL